jgi:hypothetical protein
MPCQGRGRTEPLRVRRAERVAGAVGILSATSGLATASGRLPGWWGTAAVAAVCLVVAGLSLLIPSAPTTDSWGWIVWGREILHLELSTVVPGAPSWKPLPILVTTPLALAGSAAPVLWLFVARAAGLASLFIAYRLADRLAGRWAGLLAVVGLVLSADWLREFAHGYSEPLAIGLLLAAVDQHLCGRPRWALLLGGLVALARPEAWCLVALYGIVLWRRGGAHPLLIAAVLVAVPALWLVPDWIGSGDPFHAGKASRAIAPTGSRATLEALGEAALIDPLPLSVTAVGGTVLALHLGDRRIVGIAAAVLVWTALLAALMLAGYPASSRFFVLPTALLSVLGAAGAVRVVEAAHNRHARIALALVLALVAAPPALLRAADIADKARATVSLARLESDLRTTVEQASVQLRRCGNPTLPNGLAWVKGLVAWELDLPLRRVLSLPTSASDYVTRLSEPENEPENEPPPRLPPSGSVTVRPPRAPFVLLEPFAPAHVRLAGRPRAGLTTMAGAGQWRAQTRAGASCPRA